MESMESMEEEEEEEEEEEQQLPEHLEVSETRRWSCSHFPSSWTIVRH